MTGPRLVVVDVEPVGKWCYAARGPAVAGRRTPIWTLHARADDAVLGELRWFGGWHKFALRTDLPVWLEADCLRAIARFLDDQTTAQRRRGRS